MGDLSPDARNPKQYGTLLIGIAGDRLTGAECRPRFPALKFFLSFADIP